MSLEAVVCYAGIENLRFDMEEESGIKMKPGRKSHCRVRISISSTTEIYGTVEFLPSTCHYASQESDEQ
jgi:hypothetical protein